jgi:hypothetical protein
MAQTGEIELFGNDVAQRVEVERIELLRRQVVGPPQHQFQGCRHLGARFAAGREGRGIGNRQPETLKGLAAPSAALHRRGQADGVHGAGAGAADAIEAEIAVLQQGIEHAPGKGAVRAAALQGQADGGSFRHAVASSVLACHHHATSGGWRVTFSLRVADQVDIGRGEAQGNQCLVGAELNQPSTASAWESG